MIFIRIIAIFWLFFILTWLVLSLNTKRDIKNAEWQRGLVIRVLSALAFALLLHTSFAKSLEHVKATFGPVAATIGVVLCGLGIAFAIWARWHLGRNWSPSPAMKENHELVTSGPYKYVRHPIYTGMLVAVIGASLTLPIIFLILDLLVIVIFLLRIPKEEKFMMQLFPSKYPSYRANTKALVPFIW